MNKFKGYSRTHLIETIDEWIVGQNAERNRAIMKRKVIDGLSYMAVAEEFDLSDKRITTIVRECSKVLLEHLDEKE